MNLSVIQSPCTSGRLARSPRCALDCPSLASSSFADYLNQVYAAGRSGAVVLDGQTIFVYRGGIDTGGDMDVEFGVGVKAPFSSTGAVSYVETPAGEVATTTHWGDYATLGDAHTAVIAWCASHDRERAGPR